MSAVGVRDDGQHRPVPGAGLIPEARRDATAGALRAVRSGAGADPRPTTKVVFVGGAPRSGSTLLDLMVGQLPGHCDIGELFYMWRAGPLGNHVCACGQLFAACPFWQAVGKEAFGGWDAVDVPGLLALQRQVDRTARLPLLLLGRLLPAHRARVQAYLEATSRIYAAIARVAGAQVVVDSTKRPSTACLLRRTPGVDLSIVMVVRDPRGVVNSWSRQVALPEHAGAHSYLKRRPLHQVLRRWVTVNVITEALGRQVPLVRLRYEDLVREPQAAMHRVLALSGTEPTPEATRFLGPDGLSTGKSHAVAGGRVRMRTGPLPLQLDETWRRELPRWKRIVTVAVTGPLMWRYGYR